VHSPSAHNPWRHSPASECAGSRTARWTSACTQRIPSDMVTGPTCNYGAFTLMSDMPTTDMISCSTRTATVGQSQITHIWLLTCDSAASSAKHTVRC
jgi:hypothetical protein